MTKQLNGKTVIRLDREQFKGSAAVKRTIYSIIGVGLFILGFILLFTIIGIILGLFLMLFGIVIGAMGVFGHKKYRCPICNRKLYIFGIQKSVNCKCREVLLIERI